jgi:hypothetical protein
MGMMASLIAMNTLPLSSYKDQLLTALTLRRFAGGASIGLYESSVFVYHPDYGGTTNVGCCQAAASIRIPVNPMDSDEDALYLYVICDRTSTQRKLS